MCVLLCAQLAAALGVRRRAVRLAPADLVAGFMGFARGGLLPLAQPALVVLDAQLEYAAAYATELEASFAEANVSVQHHHQQQQLQHACAQTNAQQCPQTSGTVALSSSSSGSSGSGGGGSNSNSGDDGCLVLQCDVDAVVLLDWQQLCSLSRGAVANIAEAPRTTPGQAVAVKLDLGGGQAASAAALHGQGTREQVQSQVVGSTTPRQPCFLVDRMLGRLCRWLRALGVDAAAVQPDMPLQQLAEAVRDAAVREVRLGSSRRACTSVFVYTHLP
jgi:Mut7-C RNAse domain